MKSLLVCFAVLAMTSAEEMKSEEPKQVLATLPYYNFGLNYAHAVHPYHYTYQPTVQYQPIQYKYVPKEYEVEVKSYQPALPEEACLNVFGVRVPCHKAKRSADEEQETEVAQPVKIETPYYYAHPNYYAHQIATPLTYAHTYHPYHYNYYHHASPVVTYAEPKVQEIEVPTPVYKHVVEKVEVAPLCQNYLGMAVPCSQIN